MNAKSRTLSRVDVNGTIWTLEELETYSTIGTKKTFRIYKNGNIRRVCQKRSTAVLNFKQEVDKEITNQDWREE